MKKNFLMLFTLGLYFVNLNAACYIQPQYPGSGPAPKAYCWDISYVTDMTKYPTWEDTRYKSSTTTDFNGTIVAKVDAYGYGDNTNSDINYQNMTLVGTQNIINEYNILVGKRYWYMSADSNVSNGMIHAKNYSTVKDQLYVK